MGKEREKGKLCLRMGVHMKGSLRRIIQKAKVYLLMKTASLLRGYFLKES